MGSEVDENDEAATFTKSFFDEKDQVNELITEVISNDQDLANSKKCSQVIEILERYQEQPGLLDPHLESLVTPLMKQTQKSIAENNTSENTHRIFMLVYNLCKVRGYKTVVKFFPHDVDDLVRVFQFLEAQPREEYRTWPTRYVLLLWLSIIVLIPFDLSSVDPSWQEDQSSLPSDSVVYRMIALAKEYLGESGKSRDGAAVFLSRLLTRPDMKEQPMSDFFQFCNTILSSSSDPFLITGVYTCLSMIFKHGTRRELWRQVPSIYDTAVNLTKRQGNPLQRKLSIKLVQRIGLTFLPPRTVSWRYQRGSRSLAQNLNLSNAKTQNENQKSSNQEDEEDDINVPEEIEDVLGSLLDGLRDKDTIVRWSTAKGVGRITMRLPKDMADDVVEHILDLFSENEGDGAWHGGCLSLAELARRGLLLPSRLPDVIPVIIRALQYDVRKGSHSVGAHVRDAACYVCWAFARAYAPSIMEPYVHRIAKGLLVMAVFDREVNCRRAAAAAFQENVGRQGNFPHGIDILTTADYFTLCSRSNAFLNISVFIGQFNEYRRALIDHLVERKTAHWDINIRDLSARSLAALTSLDPSYLAHILFNTLIPFTLDKDLNTRHGNLLAASEVMLALSKAEFSFSSTQNSNLYMVVPNIEAERLYRGRGGEIMRAAVCRFIECMAKSGISLPETAEFKRSHGPKTIKMNPRNRFQQTLDENLKHPKEEIAESAVRSLKAFAMEYYPEHTSELEKNLIDKYLTSLEKSNSFSTRRGHALALGALPAHLVYPSLSRIIKVLSTRISVEKKIEDRDVESRRNAVLGLSRLCSNIEVGPRGINSQNMDSIFTAFIRGTCDYCVDNRGDVGSWVRMASMKALVDLTLQICQYSQDEELFTYNMAQEITCVLLKQSVEKIDRVRDCAGQLLLELLNAQDPTVPFIPHRDELLDLLYSQNQPIRDFSAPSLTFPAFVETLAFDEFRYPVLCGYVVSSGGISEHVVRHAGNALTHFIEKNLSSCEESIITKLADDMVKLFQNYSGEDRIILPLLKTLDLILSNDLFDSLTPDKSNFSQILLETIRNEIRQSRSNVVKFLNSIPVLCNLLKFGSPTRETALIPILGILGCRFPKARMEMATSLYTTLLTYPDIFEEEEDEEKVDQVLEILTETEWSKSEPIKDARDRIGKYLKVKSKQ